MTVYYTLTRGQPLTPEEIAMLNALEDRPIVYDEDSPALTPEAIAGFRRSAAERNRRLARETEEAERNRRRNQETDAS